jgi:type IV pilus assembly protein PilM
MAKSSSVWGIEIGQTALKALRCTLEDGEVVADAFDYIEYPKILSQPEAVADELISEAVELLLERNEAINEKVCISVPGQSGLAKFFKPPPVEVKKVGDIVRYEARQQIPFDLDDVVWDFQMMPGSMVEEGYALESEVGLFAMKREQAYRQLLPFDQANIEVDIVQLAPLALYNMVTYDRMHERIEEDMFDADNPPASSVLLSIGTDSSDLIVTNGFRIWQRSMPIGGNHFTRQLTKDLKLTFAKAEHLKRNAREAVDPKLVFQTMRPVFNDLVTEVQRSIGFFRSIDKKAEISELLVTGNTVKMPGLAAYLGKNLGYDVHVLDRFDRLKGDDVLSIPTFRDNAPTFAVCYGLCLQGLGVAQVHASLVPREILTARMIRAKKPWTLAGLAALMIGMSANYAFTEKSWATTHDDLWSAPISKVKAMEDHRSLHKSKDDELVSKLTYLNVMGEKISGNAEGRVKWMEIIKTINAGIPRFEYPGGKIPSPKELPLEERKGIHVLQLDSKHYADLSTWFTPVATRYREELRNWARITKNELPEDELGPTGPGWVFEMHCYHYYNSPKNMGLEGSNHIRKYMTTNYRQGSIKLPIGKDAAGNDILDDFTFAELGLSYPLLLDDTKPQLTSVPNPDFDPSAMPPSMLGGAAGFGAPATAQDGEDPAFEPPLLEVQKQEFIYQIVWQETLISGRLLARANPAPEAAEGGEPAAAEGAVP